MYRLLLVSGARKGGKCRCAMKTVYSVSRLRHIALLTAAGTDGGNCWVRRFVWHHGYGSQPPLLSLGGVVRVTATRSAPPRNLSHQNSHITSHYGPRGPGWVRLAGTDQDHHQQLQWFSPQSPGDFSETVCLVLWPFNFPWSPSVWPAGEWGNIHILPPSSFISISQNCSLGDPATALLYSTYLQYRIEHAFCLCCLLTSPLLTYQPHSLRTGLITESLPRNISRFNPNFSSLTTGNMSDLTLQSRKKHFVCLYFGGK